MKPIECNKSNNYSKKFFFENDKKEYIAQCLLKAFIGDKSYKLILVSCYFTIKSCEKLLKNIYINVRPNLSKIEIYIDRITAINIGKEKIEFWLSSLPIKINVELKIWNNNNLFHSKAYCLLADYKSIESIKSI